MSELWTDLHLQSDVRFFCFFFQTTQLKLAVTTHAWRKQARILCCILFTSVGPACRLLYIIDPMDNPRATPLGSPQEIPHDSLPGSESSLRCKHCPSTRNSGSSMSRPPMEPCKSALPVYCRWSFKIKSYHGYSTQNWTFGAKTGGLIKVVFYKGF